MAVTDAPKIITSRFDVADGHTLEGYVRTGGYEGLKAAIEKLNLNDTAFRFAGHDGVETIAWTDGGLTFTVTGQTGQDALRRIAAAVYAQMD